MDAAPLFRGKKITVMGIDPEGRGVRDALFLAACGADVLVTDLKSAEDLAPSVAQLKEHANISFALGGHRPEDFKGRDLIVRAASVPLDSPYLAVARADGTAINTDETLFLSVAPPVTVVGITGTRGKSTVTHMVHAILKEAGVRAYLGGNVRGMATLPLLNDITEGDTVVMELDSWKLQGFGEARISPHIAVFTTFYQDHMDYYKNDMDAYLADKANLFEYQTPNDTLILGKQCAPLIIERYGDKIDSRMQVTDELGLPDTWQLCVPGQHNRYDAALALAAARALGIDDGISRTALQSFPGVPGRLELIGEKRGVRIYNDNNSTTPDATIAALRAIGTPNEQRVVLIMGGDEKHLDMSALIAELPKWCKVVVLFKERGTDRIREEVLALKNEKLSVYEEEGLAACVERAWNLCKKGDTFLFSPAFASFGKYFRNEYDRGGQFTALVAGLR